MANEKLNRLLSGQGSVEEKYRLLKELPDEELQMAANAGCPEAKLEIELRASARRDAREEKTLSIARGALTISICSLIVAIVAAINLAGRPP